jgi:hypothetical protein
MMRNEKLLAELWRLSVWPQVTIMIATNIVAIETAIQELKLFVLRKRPSTETSP